MTTEYKKALGKRIKVVRQQLEIKQKDLAKSMDISPGYLSSLESGNSNASVISGTGKTASPFEFVFLFSQTILERMSDAAGMAHSTDAIGRAAALRVAAMM